MLYYTEQCLLYGMSFVYPHFILVQFPFIRELLQESFMCCNFFKVRLLGMADYIVEQLLAGGIVLTLTSFLGYTTFRKEVVVADTEQFFFHAIQFLVVRPIVLVVAYIGTDERVGCNELCFQVRKSVDAKVRFGRTKVDVILLADKRDEETQFTYKHGDWLDINAIDTILNDSEFELVAVDRISLEQLYDVNNTQETPHGERSRAAGWVEYLDLFERVGDSILVAICPICRNGSLFK